MGGIKKNSSSNEIKKAFRKLAMKYHPDRNPGDKKAEARFKEISEAYEILKDESKRNNYDNFGHNQFYDNNFNQESSNFSSFTDIFGDVFGDFMGKNDNNSNNETKNKRGSNIDRKINITLEEAYNGLKKELKIKCSCKCEFCDGRGSKKNYSHDKCENCLGSGKIRHQQGFFIVEKTCNNCSGSGLSI